MMNWVVDEMKTIDLGDARLNARALKILDSMNSDPTSSLPKSCQSWAETKGAYRFFDNEKVTPEAVLAPHKAATIQRIQQQKRVLLIQDTTELNYSGQQEKNGVGPSHLETEKVLFYHPLLAVTPERIALGLVDIHSWYRKELLSKQYTPKQLNTKRLHHQHISEKESYRWLLGYRQAAEVAKQCPDTHVVMVADRESDISDIYDEAEYLEGKKADWLIRAKHVNRALLTTDEKRDPELLYDKLLNQTPIGQLEFNLPRRPSKPSRRVSQSIRILRVKLHPPTGRRGKLRLRPCWVTAILAREESPPEGEKPVEWLLFTNIELNAEIRFQDVLQWYLCRWQIEVFFFILKSGCQAEALQLKEPSRFLPCLAMYSIIAWRILMMTHIGRINSEVNCEVVFTPQEWRCAYSKVHKIKPPDKPPTLNEMIVMVARLGGFLARKGDGQPGAKTIWLGLQRLADFMQAIDAYNQYMGDTCG